jgi:hypothetical protein
VFFTIILFFSLLKSWHLPSQAWWFLIVIHFHSNCWKRWYYCSGSSNMHVAHLITSPKKNALFGLFFPRDANCSFLFTPMCGELWQWCRAQLRSYERTTIAKPWHISWSLDFGFTCFTGYLAASCYRLASSCQYGQAPLGYLVGHGARSLQIGPGVVHPVRLNIELPCHSRV